MKTRYLLFGALNVIAVETQAQFSDHSGNEVSSCDCMEPISHLDFTISLPENYNTYDYIQFIAYRNNIGISSRTIRPSQINNGTIKLNVLNKSNKALRSLFGKEYGRYRGVDFTNVSYNAMCEFGNVELEIVALGITKLGEETTYELDGSKTKVLAKTVEIFDGGVELTRSTKLPFRAS